MLNEEYTNMTQNYTFTDDTDDGEIQTAEKSKTVMTDEHREAFRKIKFGLVKPTPFNELLKIAYVKSVSSTFAHVKFV